MLKVEMKHGTTVKCLQTLWREFKGFWSDSASSAIWDQGLDWWQDIIGLGTLARDHGTQLQSARAGCGGMRHLHAAAKWELRGSSGVARQRAAGCRSLCTSPNIPGGGPLRAGEHGRDRWRTSEASLGLHWPSGRYRGYRPACCLLLWLLLRRRQRPLRAWVFTSLRAITCRRCGSLFAAELDKGCWKGCSQQRGSGSHGCVCVCGKVMKLWGNGSSVVDHGNLSDLYKLQKTVTVMILWFCFYHPIFTILTDSIDGLSKTVTWD